MIDWFAVCSVHFDTDMLAAAMVLADTDCDNGPFSSGRQVRLNSEDSLLSALLLAVCTFFKYFHKLYS